MQSLANAKCTLWWRSDVHYVRHGAFEQISGVSTVMIESKPLGHLARHEQLTVADTD